MAEQIKAIRFLVLDEADRMIETGHFAELDNIVRLTSREFQNAISDPDFDKSKSGETEPPADLDGQEDHQLQTFVFSATLSMDLQRNLKKRQRYNPKKKHTPASTLGMSSFSTNGLWLISAQTTFSCDLTFAIHTLRS